MKYPTIWESANRPLFVRSVWLEGSRNGGGVGGQRHFLLDYEPTRQRRCGEAQLKAKRDLLKSAVSYDFADYDPRGTHLELIGSTKAQYQVLMPKNPAKPPLSYRRCLSSQRLNFDTRRRDDAPSKLSSLQDINSTLSTMSQSDEKLAERVLNWLDLAGKSPLIRPVHQSAPPTAKKPASLARRERMLAQQERNALTCSRRPDSVKHITIIFNKEGVPVRYNRAAKLGDLNTNKRYVGNIASARLYGTSFESTIDKAKLELKRQRPRTTSVLDKSEEERFPSGRKSFDDSSAMQDSKRQLHIFMPSLPKKTLLPDDAVSVLSAAVSEQCRM